MATAMDRGLSRAPTMEQRALAKVCSSDRKSEIGMSLTSVKTFEKMMSSRHWAQPNEFDEDLRQRAMSSRAMKKQLSMASQAANNPSMDPLNQAWEDRRRSQDEELQQFRSMVSGARLAGERGTGFYSERKYKMTG